MPARKKKEVVEESTEQATPKKSAAKKPKAVEAVAPAVPETVGVPVEMLSQLMAQIQNLTQEVGALKAQASEPVVTVPVVEEVIKPTIFEVTQQEIDEAEANPDVMPDDFFAEELPDVEIEDVPIDETAFEEKNPGLLAEIESFNGHVVDEVQEPLTLHGVTQQEIDAAEANPDLMPDDFFAEELPDVVVDEVPVDETVFEEQNPGLLAEIESFNETAGHEVKEPLSLGELTQAEIDFATANPDAMPDNFYGEKESDFAPVEIPEVDTTKFEEENPGLLAEIESFNMDMDDDASDAISPEEAGALLAGFDEVMQDSESASEDESGEVSADEIAAMFASAGGEAPVAEVVEESGDMSADEIAAMFASAGGEAPVAEAVEESGDMSADEIAAMFASASGEAPVAEVVEESGDMSADEIAAMFASAGGEAPVAETPEVLSAESLTDDEIAQAVDMGAAEPVASDEAESDYSDDDLDDLTEEDLVAMIRQNIDAQADEMDIARAEAEAAALASEEAQEAADSGGVMSAAEIAALLQTPDEEGDVVPAESSAMSDDELMALLAQTGDSSVEAPVPTADDIDNTISFVQPEPEESAEMPQAKPAAVRKQRATSSDDEPEIGAVRAVPVHLAIRAMALPMRFDEGKILCRVAEPIDQVAIDRLSKEVGFGIVVEAAPIEEVINGIRVAYAEVQEVNARFAMMAGATKRPSLVEKLSEIWKKPA